MVASIVMIPFIAVLTLPQAQELTRLRHAAIDKMSVELSIYAYHAPGDDNWQDARCWTALTSAEYGTSHRLAIVRPSVRYERLLHDPAVCAEPVRIFVHPSGYTIEHPTPNDEGYVSYAILNSSQDAVIPVPGPLNFTPALWLMDIQFPDQTNPLVSTRNILEHPSACVLGAAPGGATRFTATVNQSLLPVRYTVDINDRGTPVYSRVELLYENQSPAVLELFVESTVDLGDFELPLTAISTIQNPNIAPPFNDMRAVWRHEVASFQLLPHLTTDDIDIVPTRRNSVITHENIAAGSRTRSLHWYDNNGNEVRSATQTFGGFASKSDSNQSNQSTFALSNWRVWGAGFAMTVPLGLVGTWLSFRKIGTLSVGKMSDHDTPVSELARTSD